MSWPADPARVGLWTSCRRFLIHDQITMKKGWYAVLGTDVFADWIYCRSFYFSFNKALYALMLLTVGLIAVALHLAEVSVIHVVARRTAWVG